jgi:hypothetical protein
MRTVLVSGPTAAFLATPCRRSTAVADAVVRTRSVIRSLVEGAARHRPEFIA